jgi:hypothetical protein
MHPKPPYYWTLEKITETALQFETRSTFRKSHPSAYERARRKTWLDRVCAHMVKKIVITLDSAKVEADKYSTRSAFAKGSPGIYEKARQENWLDEVCNDMASKGRLHGYWNFENVHKEAKKYTFRSEFLRNARGAYNSANKQGWLNQVCSHMSDGRSGKKIWTKKMVTEEAEKYCHKVDFERESPDAYNAAVDKKWIDSFCEHME